MVDEVEDRANRRVAAIEADYNIKQKQTTEQHEATVRSMNLQLESTEASLRSQMERTEATIRELHETS